MLEFDQVIEVERRDSDIQLFDFELLGGLNTRHCCLCVESYRWHNIVRQYLDTSLHNPLVVDTRFL